MNKNIELYNKHFVQSNREMVHLFEVIKAKYNISSAIYPGSFVHISPAFVFSMTAFIDSDRRVAKFFADPEVFAMVEKEKMYTEKTHIEAFQQNYEKKTALEEKSFDLMISQYAGFISQSCKKYLKTGGILLVNNSHADAGIAYLDKDYKLIGVANWTKDKWRISEKKLEEYFIPKKGKHPSKKELLATMTGVGYKKTASNYIFKRMTQCWKR